MKRFIILVPVLFAVYVALNFFAANPILISLSSLADVFLTVILIAITAQSLSWLYFRNITKSSIGATFILLVFFSYTLLEQMVLPVISKLVINRTISQILFAVLISISLCLIYLCLKREQAELGLLTTFLVIFAGVLPIMPLTSIIQYNMMLGDISSPVMASTQQLGQQSGKSLPDIYHIVLDGYGREDVLRDHYNYDNADFIMDLESLGFTVRNDCHANYIWTAFSVASMLSLEYIPNLNVDSEIARQMMIKKIGESGAGQLLVHSGYDYYEISSPVPTSAESDFMKVYMNSNNIRRYIIYQTPLKYYFGSKTKSDDNEAYDYWRNDIIMRLKRVANIQSEDERPIFAYCHICIPHPPFVFDSSGNPINPPRPFSLNDCNDWMAQEEDSDREYRQLYPQQVAFANLIIKQTINDIIGKSKNPTLIIISSDHGPRLLVDQKSLERSQFQEAKPIFMAYRLPEGDNLDLADVKSPVNLYRKILNHYCGTNYPMLEDRFFYTKWPGKIQNYEVVE